MKNLLRMKKKGWIGLALVTVMIAACIVVPMKGLHASGYDYQKAVSYADTWGGTKRNSEYTSYSADCMNYVSQCLYAGGLATGSDWQPYNSAWVGVTPFVRAMRTRGYQVIENPTASQIYPGNPVIYKWAGESYDWSHATICVGYDSNGTPIVNGHTGDRYHVSWNYAVGSASKMCTILINDGGPQIGNTVDLGSSFYAYINSTLAGKPITNVNGNVCLQSKGTSDEEIRSQVWKFDRQEDGSYVIYSCKDNNVLDVDGAGTISGTNVQTYVYWGHPAQHWYIYELNGEYRLKSQCSDCLLDVANSGKADGTNIQMCKNNGNTAQKFQIVKVNTPGITTVYCTPGTGNTPTTISWDATTDTSVYNVRISGDLQKDVWNVTGTSCQVDLPAGSYEVYVDACNAYSYNASNTITFTVPEPVIETVEDNNVNYDEAEDIQDNVNVEEAEGTQDNVNVEEIEDTQDDVNVEGTEGTQDDVNVEEAEGTQDDVNVEETEDTQDDVNVEETEDTQDNVNVEETEGIQDNVNCDATETVQNNMKEDEAAEGNEIHVNIVDQTDNSVTNNTVNNIWQYFFGTELPAITNDTTEHADNESGYEFDNYGGTDNDTWSREHAIQENEEETFSEAEPLTVITENSTEAELESGELIENESNMTTDDIEETTEAEEEVGIRIIQERDEQGNLQGIFLRIVYPSNGENQVLTIRLI